MKGVSSPNTGRSRAEVSPQDARLPASRLAGNLFVASTLLKKVGDTSTPSTSRVNAMVQEKTPTVYIVDDDKSVRNSLEWLLQSVGYATASFASGREFLAEVTGDVPGCLLLDVRMPQLGGFELQARLNEMRFSLPIIFLTGHGDIPMTVRALKSGAFEFIEKPYNDQSLIDKVNDAICLSLNEYESRNSRASNDGLLATLSRREREVVDKMVEGKSSKLIARELDISFKTVEVHRANIREKLKIGSVADLVRMVLRN
jgi:two-component system response regulator FixJ